MLWAEGCAEVAPSERVLLTAALGLGVPAQGVGWSRWPGPLLVVWPWASPWTCLPGRLTAGLVLVSEAHSVPLVNWGQGPAPCGVGESGNGPGLVNSHWCPCPWGLCPAEVGGSLLSGGGG